MNGRGLQYRKMLKTEHIFDRKTAVFCLAGIFSMERQLFSALMNGRQHFRWITSSVSNTVSTTKVLEQEVTSIPGSNSNNQTTKQQHFAKQLSHLQT